MFEGAHIVETVGQFDEYDADVGDHGEKHFADIFRLAVFAIGELDFFYFGDAVDDVGDLVAEGVGYLPTGNGGVFNGVVKQAGSDGGGIELHLGEDEGDFQWMQGKWFAGRAFLSGVVLEGKVVGALDDGDVVCGTIAAHSGQQHLEGIGEVSIVSVRGRSGGVRGDHG
jgi:hypothetical protein